MKKQKKLRLFADINASKCVFLVQISQLNPTQLKSYSHIRISFVAQVFDVNFRQFNSYGDIRFGITFRFHSAIQ